MKSFDELYLEMVKGTKFDYPNSVHDLQKEIHNKMKSNTIQPNGIYVNGKWVKK